LIDDAPQRELLRDVPPDTVIEVRYGREAA
jgi:hypothetical protein